MLGLGVTGLSTITQSLPILTVKLTMSLLDVPDEILVTTILLVIQAAGLDEAMKLRLTCHKISPSSFRFQSDSR
jgi:hypothetical protein